MKLSDAIFAMCHIIHIPVLQCSDFGFVINKFVALLVPFAVNKAIHVISILTINNHIAGRYITIGR